MFTRTQPMLWENLKLKKVPSKFSSIQPQFDFSPVSFCSLDFCSLDKTLHSYLLQIYATSCCSSRVRKCRSQIILWSQLILISLRLESMSSKYLGVKTWIQLKYNQKDVCRWAPKTPTYCLLQSSVTFVMILFPKSIITGIFRDFYTPSTLFTKIHSYLEFTVNALRASSKMH